jgi:tRNA-dihydrouridine synthase B
MKIGYATVESRAFLAPMAGITHRVFRWIVSEVGAVPGFTEMVSAEGLVRDKEGVLKALEPFPGEKPLAVQLFGGDPDILAAAARIAVERGADLVDINMGCPVRKVLKAGAGAALLRDKGKLSGLLKKVRSAVTCPLTVKIRSGWTRDEIIAPAIARLVEDSGIDAIIVHPRTVVQGFTGRADWAVIGEVKRVVRIPVIGNGDIRSAGDARRMVEETGCDGVMVGRGALGNPWIFRGIACNPPGREVRPPDLSERQAVILRHLERNVNFLGEKKGIKDFGRHLAWYTKGMRDCAGLRKQIIGVDNMDGVREAIDRFFGSMSVGVQQAERFS